MTKYRVEIWDECSELPSDVQLFGSQRWWKFQKQVWGNDLRCIVVLEKNQIKAWMFYLEYNQWIWRNAVLMPYNPYGGPFFHSEFLVKSAYECLMLQTSILDQMVNQLKQKYDSLLFYPENIPAKYCSQSLWQICMRHTYLCDLNTDITIQYAQNTRRNLQKARKLNSCIKQPNIDKAIQVNVDFLKNKGIPLVLGEPKLRKFMEEGLDQGILQCFGVESDVGQAWSIHSADEYQQRFYLHFHAAETHYLSKGGQFYLMHELLQSLAPSSFHFDFCGADHSGIAEFKSQFATRLESKYSLSAQISKSRSALLFLKSCFKKK